jgi:hypothetical protein
VQSLLGGGFQLGCGLFCGLLRPEEVTMDTVQTAGRLLVRVQEIAQIPDVPAKTIYHRARKDEWPCYRVGRDVRFDLDEILRLIRDEP